MRIPKGGIAFFDSGIGGLTVMSACEKRSLGDVFYYYGDNTHAPYGNLPPNKIMRYVHKAFRRFQRIKACAVVIACNTATAVCIERLRKKYKMPIIGAEPAILSGAMYGGEVWLLATKATSESVRVMTLCKKASDYFPQAEIRILPQEHLAAEIETHIFEQDHDYLPLLPKGGPNAIVLGCTHYIYIKEQIQARYQCKVVDGNEGIAKRLQNVLQKMDKKEGKTVEKRRQNFKNRDSRPLSTIFLKILGFLTTKKPKQREKRRKDISTNKCSRKNSKKARIFKEKHDNATIYFLGKNAEKNMKIYKQMFVL